MLKIRVKCKVCVWSCFPEHPSFRKTTPDFSCMQNNNKKNNNNEVTSCCCCCRNLLFFPPALPRLFPPKAFSKRSHRIIYCLGCAPSVLTDSDCKNNARWSVRGWRLIGSDERHRGWRTVTPAWPFYFFEARTHTHTHTMNFCWKNPIT